jgi:hypothetical protein
MSKQLKDKVLPENATPSVGDGAAQGNPQQQQAPFGGPEVMVALPAGAFQFIHDKIFKAELKGGMEEAGIVQWLLQTMGGQIETQMKQQGPTH